MKLMILKTAVLSAAFISGSIPAFAAAVSQSTPAARVTLTQRTGAATRVLPPALRPVFYQSLAKDAGVAYNVNAKGCATLPAAKLTVCFNGSGAHFSGGGSLALHLMSYGRGDALSSVKTIKPVIEANRVSYAHGNLTEWWRVLPVGFEQGFTIAKRPSGNGALTLALAASDKAEQNHDALGWGRLRYGDLVVTDAQGNVIPATLKTKGDRVLIAVNDTHATYPLTVDPLVWLEQEVTASDGVAHDEFGYSVAVSGATALVGVPDATVNGNGYQGAAYVFTMINGTWTQSQKLIASDGAVINLFGLSVAVSGTTALIGAPDATINGNVEQGATYVFTNTGGTWAQTQKLTASNGAADDQFGWSVALSGPNALVGAPPVTVNGNSAQGAVYVFVDSGGSWTQTTELTASDGESGDFFGLSVALDGSTALIGAPQGQIGVGGTGPGAAYVFVNSGGSWTQVQKLTASDGETGDVFGGSVALSGETALVGAAVAIINGNFNQGAAYVFTESGDTWAQTQKLIASDGAENNYFGQSVALSGTTAFIGAPDAAVNGNPYQGAAYMFNYSDGNWTQVQKFTADGSHGLGNSMALDGPTAIIGAFGTTINGNSAQGAAYLEGASNLGLAVSAPQTVGQGQQYTSQTIATNNASAASPAVSATITVPAAASFISATATQGSCSEASGVVTCDFGQIPGNAGTATANVTLKATGSSGTTIHNTASISKATPALTASAPTQITSSQNCPAGYTTYSGTLAANAGTRGPSYEAPAGVENAILYAPAGFKLYARVGNSEWGSRRQQGFSSTEVHRWGPAGTYAWGVKAGDTGGAYTFCLLHP